MWKIEKNLEKTMQGDEIRDGDRIIILYPQSSGIMDTST